MRRYHVVPHPDGGWEVRERWTPLHDLFRFGWRVALFNVRWRIAHRR